MKKPVSFLTMCSLIPIVSYIISCEIGERDGVMESEVSSETNFTTYNKKDFYLMSLEEAEKNICYQEALKLEPKDTKGLKLNSNLIVNIEKDPFEAQSSKTVKLNLIESSKYRSEIEYEIFIGSGVGWGGMAFSANIKPLSERAFNEIKRIYGDSTSKVKWVPGTTYTLTDFFPPKWQAFIGKNLLSQQTFLPYSPGLDGKTINNSGKDRIGDIRKSKHFSEDSIKELGIMNCWNSSLALSFGTPDRYAYLFNPIHDDVMLKHLPKIGTVIKDTETLKPGDMIIKIVDLRDPLFKIPPGSPKSGIGIDHTMIYVDEDVFISYDKLAYAPSFKGIHFRPNGGVRGSVTPSVFQVTDVMGYLRLKLNTKDRRDRFDQCVHDKLGKNKGLPEFTPNSFFEGKPLKWDLFGSWVVPITNFYRRYPLVYDEMGRASISPTAYEDFFEKTNIQ